MQNELITLEHILKEHENELNETILNIEEKTIKLPITEKYDGNHPIEEKHYYEHKLQEKNIIEIGITNIQTINNEIEITYMEY